VILLGPSAFAAIVVVRCPHCGEVQARARAPEGHAYACRACGASFTRSEGPADPKKAGGPR